MLDHEHGEEGQAHEDGGLAVIHDSKLIRTSGREGVVEDLTTEELTTADLKNCFLEGTTETIPS